MSASRCEIRIPDGEGVVLLGPSAEQVAAMWDYLRGKYGTEPVVVFGHALSHVEVDELNAALLRRV